MGQRKDVRGAWVCDPTGDVEGLGQADLKGHLREFQPDVDTGAVVVQREDALSPHSVLISYRCVLFALVFADVTAYSWTLNVK